MLLLALAWFWYDSSGAREAGVRSARDACESEALQLLDDRAGLLVPRTDQPIRVGMVRWRPRATM